MAHKLIILVVLIHHCCERNKGNIFFLNSFQTWRVHLVGQDLEHWPIIGLLMAFRTLHLCFYVSFNFLPCFKCYQWTLTVIYWIFMGITINTLQNRTKAIMANYWPCNVSWIDMALQGIAHPCGFLVINIYNFKTYDFICMLF